MTVTHTFSDAKADGADTSVVRPSDWNAAHTITDVDATGHITATTWMRVGSASTPSNTTAGDFQAIRGFFTGSISAGTTNTVPAGYQAYFLNVGSRTSLRIGDDTVNGYSRLEFFGRYLGASGSGEFMIEAINDQAYFFDLTNSAYLWHIYPASGSFSIKVLNVGTVSLTPTNTTAGDAQFVRGFFTTGATFGGTTVPAEAVHVLGSQRLQYSGAIGSGSGGRYIDFTDSGPTSIARIESYDFDGTNYGFRFQGWNGSSRVPFMNGNPAAVTILGFVNIGSLSAPSNTTAGDFTALRAHFGTDGAFDSGAKLQVVGGTSYFSQATGSYMLYLKGTGTGARNWGWYVDTSGGLDLDDVSAPGNRLTIDTSGNFYFRAYAAGAVTIGASGQVVSSSDARLKTAVDKFTAGLPEIVRLSSFTRRFTWKDDPDEVIHAGFFAQEVGAIIPEALGRPGVDGMYGLHDRPVIAALVNAVSEMDATIRSLRAKVDGLAQRN